MSIIGPDGVQGDGTMACMIMRNEEPSPLVQAALTLEGELQRLEGLVTKSRKEPLTSQKNFERAARTLGVVTELEGNLRGALSNLVKAVADAGARQQTAMEALAARAKDLEARFASYRELTQRRDQLGEHGARANELIRGALAEGGVGAALPEALAELGRVAQAGEDLFALAKQNGFTDLAREADSTRQQLLSLRRKLARASGQGDEPDDVEPASPDVQVSDDEDEGDGEGRAFN